MHETAPLEGRRHPVTRLLVADTSFGCLARAVLLERWYAARANSHKVEVAGASHAVYVTRAKEVAAVIEEAASHAR